MIYENTASKKDIQRAHTFAANPPAKVQFAPVPHTLLCVQVSRNDIEESVTMGDADGTSNGPREYYGDYAGLRFDPWAKGDLIALRCKSSYRELHGKTGESAFWFIARRATVPSAPVAKYDRAAPDNAAHIVRHDRNLTRYRIPYRYLHNAAKLLGQDFETREALEAALTGAVQSFAIAAE